MKAAIPRRLALAGDSAHRDAMRVLTPVFVVVLSAASVGCTDDPCDPNPPKTSCGYCAEDRIATGNPHAGMCRYCGESTNCTGDICGDALRCENKVYLSVPGATFHRGPTPAVSSTSTTPPVVIVSPSSAHLATGSTVRWSVHWDVTVTVTAVLFSVGQPDGGGYYELPITPEQSNAGTLEVPMIETAEPPGASGCLGPMTCWTELPAATTTGDGTVSLVGAGGEVGPPMGGIGMSWDAPPSYRQSINSGTGGGGGGGGGSSNTCPTTAAAYGCCTTRGGIQVVGFGIVDPCRCPAVGTCAPRAGYCGCMACGGC